MFKWYIIHTQSGSEKKAKQAILDQVQKVGMYDSFDEIVIPVIETNEIKRGKVVKVEKKIMPGYILIKMILTDESWHLVINASKKISGFLGGKTLPKPLSDIEVSAIFTQLENQKKDIASAKLYSISDNVIVIDGPFEGFSGIVEDVDYGKSRVKVAVSIFGKATLIDLDFTQVKKP